MRAYIGVSHNTTKKQVTKTVIGYSIEEVLLTLSKILDMVKIQIIHFHKQNNMTREHLQLHTGRPMCINILPRRHKG